MDSRLRQGLHGTVRRRLRAVARRALDLVRQIRGRFASTTILVLGDSHASVFRNWHFVRTLPDVHFELCIVPGATASGLQNPNSKSQAHPRFLQSVSSKAFDAILVLLGEVDCGCSVWRRAERDNQPVERILEGSISSYAAYLDEVHQAGIPLIVISAPLPTVRDSDIREQVARRRHQIQASQLERTRLTVRFNRRIQRICSEKGIDYLNLDELCLGEDGLIKPTLRHKNPFEHHYRQSEYARLLCTELMSFPAVHTAPEAGSASGARRAQVSGE